MMCLLRAHTCAYYKSFMFFAVTSVTAKGEGDCCFLRVLKDGCWSCFAENVPCFAENKPLFWLFGRMECGYWLNVGVSDLLSVCCERKCDTCDSKKAKLQCERVRAHA